jgi:hypothetical protein
MKSDAKPMAKKHHAKKKHHAAKKAAPKADAMAPAAPAADDADKK